MSAQIYGHPAIMTHPDGWMQICARIRKRYGYIVTPFKGRLYWMNDVGREGFADVQRPERVAPELTLIRGFKR